MKRSEELMRGADFTPILNKQFSLNNSIAQILQVQQQWKKQFGAYTIQGSLLKSISQGQMVYPKNFTGIDSIAKAIALQPKFNIPTTAFDAIGAISKQHNLLFSGLRGITDLLKHNQAFSQISNLQFALSGVSSQVAAIAAMRKDWALLDDFKELTNDALTINERILDEREITAENITEIKSLLSSLGLKIDTIDSKAGAAFWKGFLISIVLAILGIIVPFLLNRNNSVSKEEVRMILSNEFSKLESKLKEVKEYRTTNRACKVMLKPKLKSFVVATLPNNFDVIVLETNHEWILISYNNPKDNMPETGWTMKKYLNRPK